MNGRVFVNGQRVQHSETARWGTVENSGLSLMTDYVDVLWGDDEAAFGEYVDLVLTEDEIEMLTYEIGDTVLVCPDKVTWQLGRVFGRRFQNCGWYKVVIGRETDKQTFEIPEYLLRPYDGTDVPPMPGVVKKSDSPWLSFESAPKDGRTVLCYWPMYDIYACGRYNGEWIFDVDLQYEQTTLYMLIPVPVVK